MFMEEFDFLFFFFVEQYISYVYISDILLSLQ